MQGPPGARAGRKCEFLMQMMTRERFARVCTELAETADEESRHAAARGDAPSAYRWATCARQAREHGAREVERAAPTRSPRTVEAPAT